MQPDRDGLGIDPMLAAFLVAVYVLGSSFLGLTGPLWFSGESDEFGSGWEFFTSIWSASLFADALFVAGSAGAGALAFRLARAGAPLGSVGTGFGLNALVYVVSYLATQDGMLEEGFGAVPFILGWGVFGLVFAAFAPAVAVRLLEGSTGAGAPPPAA